MYTVVMGTGIDSGRTLRKARAIVELPAAADSLAVVLVCAGDRANPSDAVTFFAKHGIDTTVETVDGDPPTALVTVAVDHDADLVCVGGRTRSPAGKAQLRSGAQSVIVNADRPVLVAGEPGDH